MKEWVCCRRTGNTIQFDTNTLLLLSLFLSDTHTHTHTHRFLPLRQKSMWNHFLFHSCWNSLHFRGIRWRNLCVCGREREREGVCECVREREGECVCVCEGERSFIHYKCPSCCVKLKLWRSRAILRALSSPAERAAKPDDCIALDFISSPVATHTHTHLILPLCPGSSTPQQQRQPLL